MRLAPMLAGARRTVGTPGARLFLLAACSFGLHSPSARADPVPSLDLRQFRAPTHPEALTALEPTVQPATGDYNVGLWASYAYRPIVVDDRFSGSERTMVEHQLSIDYVAGVGVAERLGVGVVLPTVMVQSGEEPPPALGAGPLPRAALGDLAFDARATLLEKGELGGLGLAALGRISLPTGDPTSTVSEGTPRSELRLLGEIGVLGSSLRASAGARIRGAEQRFDGQSFGHDLPWALGLVIRPQSFGLDRQGHYLFGLVAEGAIALTPSFASAAQSPADLTLAARRSLGEFSVTLGAGAPLSGAHGVAVIRAFTGIGWAPRTPDEDQDGIEDDKDACRALAEDKDGFEDADGCPDFDNDGDGVPDEDDRCPKEQEDLDGHEDGDGCLDPDDDGDGVKDTVDACPREPGAQSSDPKQSGCPARDRDMDGIPDPLDRCPGKAEDPDGHADDDGCPDPDDDGDGVRDDEDACRRVPGEPRSNPALHGCPSPDSDGDTFDDAVDRCPTERETFDGVTDDDGCPEEPSPGHPPLARFEPGPKGGVRLVLLTRGAFRFVAKDGGTGLADVTLPLARAVAALLNEHPKTVLLVAVRPTSKTPAAEQEALTKSFAVADTLRALTYREQVAEVIGWAALDRAPGAKRPEGVGFLVLSPVSEGP